MRLLLVPILVIALPAVAPGRRCPALIPSDDARIERLEFSDPPFGERPAEVRTEVTCRVVADNRLRDCATPLIGEVGNWLVTQSNRLRLISKARRNCPLAGRIYRFKFRFAFAD